MVRDDLKPLPAWKQWWRKGANRRKEARVTLGSTARAGLTLAITVLGATLISYGVWSACAPAGFVTGGILVWVMLWSHEQDKGRRE